MYTISFDSLTFTGSDLQSTWQEIRRKYSAAVNDGKNIDPYENSVLKFLKPFLRQPKKKKEMVLATKEKEKDSQIDDDSMELASMDNVSLDNSSNSNNNSSLPFSNSDAGMNSIKETNQNLEEGNSSGKKNVDQNLQPDPYEDAIIKAFTTELEGTMQGKAMITICQKLQDLELHGSRV